MQHDYEWILDSGAFTAWKQQKSVDLKAYIAFIKKYKELFRYAVCLDTIPGTFGGVPSTAEVERAAELSFENYLQMKEALPELEADCLIPVYHQGEQVHHLHKLVEAGAKYIGISPTNGLPQKLRLKWSKAVLAELPASIKTHGFGFSTASQEECVFHSMDSSSWSLGAGYGWIYALSSYKWTRVHITGLYDSTALERIQGILRRVRERVPSLPQELTPEFLQASGKARAVYNLIVQRAAIFPHRLYAPILLPQLVTALLYWDPRWILASFWYLDKVSTSLMKALTQPRVSLETALEGLTHKRIYNAHTKRRGKLAVTSLPGLT